MQCQPSPHGGVLLLAGAALSLSLAVGPNAAARTPQSSRTADRAAALPGYGELPLSFEENLGQTDAQVRFLSRGAGYGLFLTPGETVLALEKSTVRMRLAGADPAASLTGEAKLPGRANYLAGKDPRRWKKNIRTYGKVRAANVYPGIDLLYYGTTHGRERRLEFDFVVDPGARPEAIRLDFDGADRVSIDPAGALVLQTASGEIRQHPPVVYQEAHGKRTLIPARYVLAGDSQVSFKLGKYDRSRTLTIDPVLQYSTFLGGRANDRAEGIAVDGSGNVYLTGTTQSPDFPTKHPIGSDHPGTADVFVTKLNASGTAIDYSTYLGAGEAAGIGVDGQGRAVVTGTTVAEDFPVANALQPESAGGSDLFVSKLSADGSSLVYSTYLGTGGSDDATGVAVDTAGNAYVAGISRSVTPEPALTRGFVSKLNPDGSALLYTYDLPEQSIPNALAVDGAGAVYVAGAAGPAEFPTTEGAFQETDPDAVRNMEGVIIANKTDGIVLKLGPDGATVEYATFLGGTGDEQAVDIAVDGDGNAYVTGTTASADFPLESPQQEELAGVTDAFLVKLNPTGSALVYGTLYGGSEADVATAVAVDAQGNACLYGYTTSPDLTTKDPIQKRPRTSPRLHPGDLFIARYDPAGVLAFASYVGGKGDEIATDAAMDAGGAIYLTGATASLDFPRQSAVQPAREGLYDAFVTKIVAQRITPPRLVASPKTVKFGTVKVGSERTRVVRLRNAGTSTITGSVGTLEAPFSVISGGGAFTLEARAVLEVEVRFAPAAAGKANGSLAVQVDGGSTLSVSLTGKGR